MFKWLKSLWGPAKDWRLVKSFEWGVTRRGEDGFMYVRLFESNLGERKWEADCSLTGVDVRTNVPRLQEYHRTVVPWLNKRYVKDIPSYTDVEMLDLQKKLSE